MGVEGGYPQGGAAVRICAFRIRTEGQQYARVVQDTQREAVGHIDRLLRARRDRS
ncbi:hypothetical protein [Streptomyces sp. 3211.6]|uniref:hypothetical protein n=1 Tax=Streptomyces sp. 3211.6 TaxID=1938845 RepID=UPI0016515F4F|nr:hypothetical protein [Streptomyces sp. 3211.6]